VLDVSELSIEETAQRVIRTVEERKLDATNTRAAS
jgi:regulator of PEP synthase PpsR (kinase-PPPase family)